MVPGVEAASKTLYVGTCKGPSPYTTIQSAVDAVNDDGFTIYVCPGTYNESVQVQNKKDLTIRNYVVKNQPAPLIDPNSNNGFDITNSKEVEIRGLHSTNANNAIYVVNSPKTEVHNILVTASRYGISFLFGSHKSLAQFNTITDGPFGSIGVEQSDDVTIKQNTVNNIPLGITVIAASKTKIESNTATELSQFGIILSNATRATVRKNTANFGSYGIYLEINSTTTTISENTAKNTSEAGIYVSDNSTGNTFKKNLLQGNDVDAVDQSSGSKTAGTANIWSGNNCDISMPNDLCRSSATQRRAPHSLLVPSRPASHS